MMTATLRWKYKDDPEIIKCDDWAFTETIIELKFYRKPNLFIPIDNLLYWTIELR